MFILSTKQAVMDPKRRSGDGPRFTTEIRETDRSRRPREVAGYIRTTVLPRKSRLLAISVETPTVSGNCWRHPLHQPRADKPSNAPHIHAMDRSLSPSPHAFALFERRRHRALNAVHTWLLAGGSLLLLAVTAWIFGGPIGVIAAIVFGAISMAAVRRISPQMVLTMYKARPVSRAQFPEGVAIVEELGRRAGLTHAPKLFVVPSKLMNAFAVGRRDDSAIAITDALASRLTTRELAGVLAHEVSHIAHEDVKVMAFADMVSRYTSVMSTVGILSLILNIGGFAGGYEAPVPWFGVLVLVLAPTIGGLLQLALSRTREFDADLGAAMLTGDPDGLASALVKLERFQGRMWESLMLPGGRTPAPSVLRTHPPTEERVARLATFRETDGRLPLTQASGRGTQLVYRPSMVPKLRLPAGSRPGGLGTSLVDSADDGRDLDHTRPASAVPLCHGEGDPRIRLRRGGVWW
jgi:heat shock protein HtpX